jgi:hypothetical protein
MKRTIPIVLAVVVGALAAFYFLAKTPQKEATVNDQVPCKIGYHRVDTPGQNSTCQPRPIPSDF